MELRPLHDPKKGTMKVAALMSGGGSNLIKILEHEKNLRSQRGESPYKVVAIFSDNMLSNAEKIGKEYGIPAVINDIREFYRIKGKELNDLAVREQFDFVTAKTLSFYGVKTLAYCGYMSITTPPLIEDFLGMNVHPADLSIEKDGKRKYAGYNAVKKAMLAGELYLRSTTHLVEEEVDNGKILMISDPVKVMGDSVEENQERLKEAGDWKIFPKTLEYISDGRYQMDEGGELYFDGEPIPKGVTE